MAAVLRHRRLVVSGVLRHRRTAVFAGYFDLN